jgi:hypothetical protein
MTGYIKARVDGDLPDATQGAKATMEYQLEMEFQRLQTSCSELFREPGKRPSYPKFSMKTYRDKGGMFQFSLIPGVAPAESGYVLITDSHASASHLYQRKNTILHEEYVCGWPQEAEIYGRVEENGKELLKISYQPVGSDQVIDFEAYVSNDYLHLFINCDSTFEMRHELIPVSDVVLNQVKQIADLDGAGDKKSALSRFTALHKFLGASRKERFKN